jgi:hypothetical protein
MFGRQRRRERKTQEAALRALAGGPVDVDGIRSVIAEVLGTLSPDAVEIRESRERIRQYPERPDLDLDCRRLHIVPRAAGALDLRIDIFDSYGGVDVFVADGLPIELTAPININEDPPRPFLDVIREVAKEVAAGEFDIGTSPDGYTVDVSYWSEDGRKTYGVPDDEGITWTAGVPWS